MVLRKFAIFMMVAMCLSPISLAAKKKKKAAEKPEGPKASLFNGLKMRNIGPAVTSGRISDLAVHPEKPYIIYAAVASGGVFKTENGGHSWKPIFDHQGSYSIGCITLDPNNPHVVWVGTGENNSQRSVGYGDGVYRSRNGGKSWEHMGLKNSEHIGKIVIDPRDSNVIYVASQGPLWSAGGDRGLYKSVDGGKTWEESLTISEHTGVSDLVMDPRNPDVLYAAAYQRRRHVWTLINGGPESGIHKSEDAGKTWRKINSGLPGVDLGRIGLAIAPSQPDTLYAIVEAAERKGGFFRSTNRGETWVKRNRYRSNSPQYYQEIAVDPSNPQRVYSLDTWLHVTEDGGKTFKQVPERHKHVDSHAIWIDPHHPEHLLVGCDGGLYETFDRGNHWRFMSNLPITQFYKITVDQDTPFYNVYGGTQDNYTLGGPSRTTNVHGIANRDWFVTLGGDGFQAMVDPKDPNIIYSQYQYGGLVRFDKASGQRVDIRPMDSADGPALRFNWDSPLRLSSHDHKRLYFGAQMLFRSDDRGNTWRAISPDLSRNMDRNKLKVMGRVWSPDAVSKNASTSLYGSLVAISESPLNENLIYTGSDDGLIHVTEDGGKNWRKIDRFPGVPERTYVNRLVASRHDENRVYAVFNNHKMGDFKPYVLRSNDRGKTWQAIQGNLPERGSTYALVEDPVRQDLLFVGTEFGVFFTLKGGTTWTGLKGGMPVIAVRDLAIQEREVDLVVGTFGRGFYVLDDYSPLRATTEETLKEAAVLFKPRTAWLYIPEQPLGLRGKAFLGDDYYTAKNPDFGAMFTYYLDETYQTRKQKRRKAEKKNVKDGADNPYPSWDALREEAQEEKPLMVLTVTDADGQVVRRLEGPVTKGYHRLTWDLRYPPHTPARLTPQQVGPFGSPSRGPLALPGTYTLSLAKWHDGAYTPVGESQTFEVVPLNRATLPAADAEALMAFEKKVASLHSAVMGANGILREANNRLALIRKAMVDTSTAQADWWQKAQAIQKRLREIGLAMNGGTIEGRYREASKSSLSGRVGRIVGSLWDSTAAPTQTQLDSYKVAADAFEKVLPQLKQVVMTDLVELEGALEKAGAPWTPGRFPEWKNQ